MTTDYHLTPGNKTELGVIVVVVDVDGGVTPHHEKEVVAVLGVSGTDHRFSSLNAAVVIINLLCPN